MQIDSVTLIKRTSLKVDSPEAHIKLTGQHKAIANIDEPYDFRDPKHRKDAMTRIAHDVFYTFGYDEGILNGLVKEMETVVNELKEEFPFM